jgi:hypothetical protein
MIPICIVDIVADITAAMIEAIVGTVDITIIIPIIKQGKIMEKSSYPRRRRRRFQPYAAPWNYNSLDLINSQYSTVAQNIYNAGYMDGVTQSSVVNQTQNQTFGRSWW